MKRIVLLIIMLSLSLCGCSQAQSPTAPAVSESGNPADATEATGITFTISGNGNIVSPFGDAYTRIAHEPFLYYVGELEFIGAVAGEATPSGDFLMGYEPGMYAIRQDETRNILIRYTPGSEWFLVYRRASLPACDFSLDRCIRLEFVPGNAFFQDNYGHTTCGEGLTDPEEIAAFLSDVQAQDNPKDAGLYDLVRKPGGMFENCYVCGVIYGFFAEETNVAIRMQVTSYNDQAYSVSIKDTQYVLPDAWLQKLQDQE